MEGNQELAAEALREILSKLESGYYGHGNRLDADALQDDLEDLMDNITP